MKIFVQVFDAIFKLNQYFFIFEVFNIKFERLSILLEFSMQKHEFFELLINWILSKPTKLLSQNYHFVTFKTKSLKFLTVFFDTWTSKNKLDFSNKFVFFNILLEKLPKFLFIWQCPFELHFTEITFHEFRVFQSSLCIFI